MLMGKSTIDQLYIWGRWIDFNCQMMDFRGLRINDICKKMYSMNTGYHGTYRWKSGATGIYG